MIIATWMLSNITSVFIFWNKFAVLFAIGSAGIIGALLLLYQLIIMIKQEWNRYNNYIIYEENATVDKLKGKYVASNPYKRSSKH